MVDASKANPANSTLGRVKPCSVCTAWYPLKEGHRSACISLFAADCALLHTLWTEEESHARTWCDPPATGSPSFVPLLACQQLSSCTGSTYEQQQKQQQKQQEELYCQNVTMIGDANQLMLGLGTCRGALMQATQQQRMFCRSQAERCEEPSAPHLPVWRGPS